MIFHKVSTGFCFVGREEGSRPEDSQSDRPAKQKRQDRCHDIGAKYRYRQRKKIKVPHIDPLVESFKDLIGYYRLLVKQETQLKNRKETLIARGTDSSLIKKVNRE